MFEIGDAVIVNSFSTPKRGVVVNWFFDEGNVWIVKVEGHGTLEFSDSELSPSK